MSRNLNQIPTQATSILATDKMYIARSPFGVTDDRYILGSDIIAQLDSPLTTKGDLFGFSTVDARVPVGSTNGQILQVDSATAVGLSWSTATYPVTTTINQLLYSSANNVVGGITAAANSVLISSAGSVPSWSQTLPTIVQDNITRLGTIVSGVWNGTVVTVPFGGTGAASFTEYMPICGGTTTTNPLQSVSTAGAVAGYALTYVSNVALPTWQAVGAPYTASALTRVDDTNVTLTLGGTPATALLQPVSLTLGWTGTLSGTRGGTGVNNGTNTITIGGNLNFADAFTTSGGFAVTQNYTGITNVTFPTSGTLATTSQLPTPAALTRVDDTNVTITLGGTPATALLQATSLTMGWTGQLSLARGGTNADLSAQASNGGIVWSNATQMQIIGGTATAGQMLQSGSTAAPTWSTTTWPATSTAGRLLYSTFNNTIGELTTTASAVLTSSAASVPTWTAGSGTGDVLTFNGTIWTSAAPAASATSVIVDDTTTNATMYPTWVTANTGSLPLKVSSTKLSFNPSTGTMTLTGALKSVTGVSDTNGNEVLTFTGVASAVNQINISNAATGNLPTISVEGDDADRGLYLKGKGIGSVGILGTSTSAAFLQFFEQTTNGTNFIQLSAPASISADIAFTLPGADGAANFPLTTNGSKVLSFANPIAAAAMATLGGSGMSRLGTFTRDLTTASGTQAISGVGFQPSLVIFLTAVAGGSTYGSFGFDNGTTAYSVSNAYLLTAGHWSANTSSSIVALATGGNNQVANITTLGSDGFTLTWTKTGAPTGTLTIMYLAFK